MRTAVSCGLCLGLLLSPGGSLPEDVPDVARTLREARRALNDGKPAKAAEHLAKLDGSELGDHALLLQARALRVAGDPEAADVAAVNGLALEPPSEVRAHLHGERAATALGRDDLVEALREQKLAWQSSRDPELKAALVVEMARELEARQLPGDARNLYAITWQSWPLSDASEYAYERWSYLGAATGAQDTDPKQMLRRADRLRGRFRCERGIPTYDSVLALADLDPELRRQAENGRARCLFSRRRYAEALVAFGAIVASDSNDVEAAIMVARTRARMGDVEKSVRELLAIGAAGSRVVRARTEYLAAVLLRTREPERARTLLEQLEAQRAVRGISKAARWRLAWDDLSAGRYADSEQRLSRLARGKISDIEVQRARYWLSIARLAKDPEQGRAGLHAIAEAVPLSYYGLQSAAHLGLARAPEKDFLGERNGHTVHPPFVRASLLADAGFPSNARDELESRLRSGSLSREERITAAEQLHDLGDHFRAVRVLIDGFGDSLEQGIDPGWRDVWQLAWPRPFEGPVASAVNEFDGDPALVYAVIREESTYRPAVESPAGAIGLMQLIPPTATRIASSLGVRPFEPASLVSPSLNVRFGTYYLEQLLSQFQGEKPLAIAAYNAGPEAVASWIDANDEFATDRFVESVPYGETRRYVRKVLRSYRMYRLLYFDPAKAAAADPRTQSPESPGR